MKKQASSIFYCLLLASSVFFSCTEWHGTSLEQQAELPWDSVSLCIDGPIAPGEALCYHIEFKLDTLAGDSELARQLAAVLRDSVLRAPGTTSIQEAMTCCADSIEREWKKELSELYDPTSEFRETLQYNFVVEGYQAEKEQAEQDSILSYQTVLDCYLGGAHGSYDVHYYNFNRNTGKLLNISDIVPAEKEMLVLMAMGDQLCKDWDAKDLTELQEKTGITMLGDLYLTNNFLIDGDSIEFFFNQYEIAPYAAGLISVKLKRP